ncbi:MAG: hypothetical protein ACREQ1_10885, partial [Woeseiaceae bacterium]
MKVSKLSAGGLLTVYTRAPDPANPSIIVETAIGVAGISASTEPFNLPLGLSPTTAGGQPVTIVASQTRCSLASAKSAPAGFAKPAPYPYMIPIIAGPLYDCARIVVIQSAHIGAVVEARSATSGLPLGNPVFVTSSTVFYKLWLPLVEDDRIFVSQFGCDADGDSAIHPVVPLDSPFPMPKLHEPVRPAAPAVYAEGFLRGAQAHLLVNGVVRTGIDTEFSDAWIPAGLPLLAEDDRLTVVQSLCKQNSQVEQRAVVVTRGRLNVTVSPTTPVVRGTTVHLTVTATDKDTNAAVPGTQVLINGQVSGSTGTPFAFSPAIGLAAANGLVKGSLQYYDAAFSVALSNPPPVPPPAPATAKVHLNVGPIVSIPQTLVMKTADWTVTSQWSPSQTFTASGANVTLTLPKPPGGSGN